MKQTLTDEVRTTEYSNAKNRQVKPFQEKSFLCARRSNKRKKKEVPYSAHFHDEFESEEISVYEELLLYYPRASRKRPVVLIGPPNK